jgi:hypothetical protein
MHVVLGASGHTGHIVAQNLLARQQRFASSAETQLTCKLTRRKVRMYSSPMSPMRPPSPKPFTRQTQPMS